MSLKQYLLLMIIGTFTSFLAFAAVLYFINPFTASSLSLSLFYISLFFFLTTIFALLGYFIRSIITKVNPKYWRVNISFRQATFFALMICIAFLMQANRLFSWFNLIFLILIVTVLEFFLIKKPQT